MLIINPSKHAAQLLQQLNTSTGLLVACYCAQWCDTCASYRLAFERLSQRYAEHIFVWIDIEDDPDLLDDFDVENFPTLLIQKADHNYFFGTMLPHIQHLERLLNSLDEHARAVPGPRSFADLLASL